jgi:hypothetical protein
LFRRSVANKLTDVIAILSSSSPSSSPSTSSSPLTTSSHPSSSSSADLKRDRSTSSA